MDKGQKHPHITSLFCFPCISLPFGVETLKNTTGRSFPLINGVLNEQGTKANPYRTSLFLFHLYQFAFGVKTIKDTTKIKNFH